MTPPPSRCAAARRRLRSCIIACRMTDLLDLDLVQLSQSALKLNFACSQKLQMPKGISIALCQRNVVAF
eukprot:COSAG01_NODE_3641_length_5838_cov_3.651333_3_plen_69_part_00